jgi:hypothetical protein
MLSSTSAVRFGLYAQSVDGLGLDGVSLQALRDHRANVAALGQGIREALERARNQGLSAFAPDTGTLQVLSVSSSALRDLFTSVLEAPYSKADEAPDVPDYGAWTLAEWSEAEETLAIEQARLDSMLPPGLGGGPQHARGRWYVNGEPFTMAELFLTVRLGNVGNIDQALASDLNTLIANTELARSVMAVMSDMMRRRDKREAEAADAGASNPHYIAILDFTPFVESAGLTLDYLQRLALQFKGASSVLAAVCAEVQQNSGATIVSSNYDDALTELQSMFDSINSQNDIKKLRVDSLHNNRMNMLQGLSEYLSGVQQQAQIAERNL